MNQIETKSFVKGTIILALGTFIVKILSAIYRVPYQNLTGDNGLYIYQQIYPLYYLAIYLGLYGYSASFSKLLAESDRANTNTISKTAFYVQMIVSIVIFLVLYNTSELLAIGLGDRNFEPMIKSVAVLYILIPFTSFYRGYYQGKGQLELTSVSQILEQFIRVCGIIFSLYLYMKGMLNEYQTAHYSYIGSIVSVGMTALFLYFFTNKKDRITLSKVITNGKFSVEVAKRYIKVMIFLMLSSCLTVMIQVVDNFTIVSLIAKVNNVPTQNLHEMKGIFDRAQPFIQVGLVVSTAFSLTVLPYISKVNRKESLIFTHIAYKWSVLIGGAAAVGLFAIMPELNQILYEDMKGTAVIALQSLVLLFLSYIVTGLFILQAYNFKRMSAFIVLAATVLKIVGNVVFVSQFGFYGAVISSLFSLGIISWYLHKFSKKKFHVNYLGVPLFTLSILLMIVFACAKMLMMLGAVSFPFIYDNRLLLLAVVLVVVLLVAILYFILLIRLKITDEKEMKYIPLGKHLYKVWKKE